MSFFDKFFSHSSRISKNESLKTKTEPLGFRSVHLSISKEQIRFLLFRECDRRGRKLLFDSNAVEKLPLPSREIMCNQKSQRHNEKVIDFIETTKTHGYKYKKPSSDVACLGEMVFGSVAVVYKGENSCKIHSIPSPRRLMFTTIVHAQSRCQVNSTSELNLNGSQENSLPLISELMTQETSSSDSKLYRRETIAQKYSSTYPWIKHNFPTNKITQCCEFSDLESNLSRKALTHVNNARTCLEKLCSAKETSDSNAGNLIQEKTSLDGDWSCASNLCLPQKDMEGELSSVYDSSNITSNESENFSSVSGSLSSLRRRWSQSYSTSLDSTNYETISCSPSKRRTKLGMALVLELGNTFEEKLEKFLFNHTIVIDSIMSKLQSSVELAYARNENFVDLIYSAFLESRQAVYELINGGKYETPIWCSLVGDPGRGLEPRIHSHKDNVRLCKSQESVGSVQLTFLNEFYEVLVKFDTKDTNFFISTLLTAVLTHHLSWVTSIAETDSSATDLTVIKSARPYNPIWAQLNDLNGLLGSPLKSAKTVITGGENKKNHMATIIHVMTYFIRCYNVIENVYEVDIEDILGNVEKHRSEEENFDSDFESDGCVSSIASNFENKVTFKGKNFLKSQLEESDSEISIKKHNSKIRSEEGLRRSKNYLSDLRIEEQTTKLYPDINDMAKRENINVADLSHPDAIENFLIGEKLTAEIKVPRVGMKPNLEEYLSPDEGYDTIDSTKTDNFNERKVHMEKQCSAPSEKKNNIVFVLGESEELVDVKEKIIVNKSTLIEMEMENVKNSVPDRVQYVPESALLSGCEDSKEIDEISRTSERLNEKLWVNGDSEKIVEHSTSQDCHKRNNSSMKMPWMIREINFPRAVTPCQSRQLEVSSVLGGVNQHYNSEQVIQGVLDPRNLWEQTLLKDLYLSSHNPILEKDVSESLCIVGDMNSWEVSVFSSSTSILDRNKQSGVRVGMSQLVAEMLESFLYLHAISLSPGFCLVHIEKKLREIYLKSKSVAELLDSTDVCSIDYLTAKLDIAISDVPLLLSVATTHSPHISEKLLPNEIHEMISYFWEKPRPPPPCVL